MKRKVLAWITTMVMAVTMMFGGTAAAFAEDEVVSSEVVTAKVDVAVQTGTEFLVEHKIFDVRSDLAEACGFEDEVTNGVSALDALVAAHANSFGNTKKAITEKLTVSYGNAGMMMGANNGYSGFAINGDYVMDAEGNGYNMNQAKVKDGDSVDFFWYEDEYWGDYVAGFYDNNGNRVNNIGVKTGEPITLTVKGFMFMNGYNNPPMEPLEGVVICNAVEGNADPLLVDDDVIETDEDGNVTLNLEAGIYNLVAYDMGDFGFRVVMPYCVVKVSETGEAIATSDVIDSGSVPYFKNVELEATSMDYTGEEITPVVTIVNNIGEVLEENTDYEVSYSNNIEIGTATVTVTGLGDYETISKELEFAIVEKESGNTGDNGDNTGDNGGNDDEDVNPVPSPAPAAFAGATLKYKSTTYSGKAKMPAVTVKNNKGDTLVKGTDYTVTYKDNTKVGTAKAVVTGKGDYANCKSITKTFKINPKGVTLKKVASPAKHKMKVTWAKRTKQVTGYQIKYSKKSSMANAKTVTVKKNSTTTKTIKKLKKGKRYVQVRTYKVVDGKKYYSKWSAKKSVKVK